MGGKYEGHGTVSGDCHRMILKSTFTKNPDNVKKNLKNF